MLADLNPSDPGLRVTEAQSAETRNLYLNNRRGKPFHDRRARQAAAWLIDRDRISYDVYDGTVDPLYSLIPTSITGHTTSFFDNYPHKDAEKARRLLVEAGEEIPLSFTYGYAAGRGSAHEEAAEVKKQLEADGLFKVTLRGYEWDEFQKSWAEESSTPTPSAGSPTTPIPTPSAVLSSARTAPWRRGTAARPPTG